MLRRYYRSISFLLAFVLIPVPAIAEGDTENTFSEAQFVISSDPTAVVLYVHLLGGLSGTFKSMSLYGDGRLVLKEGRGEHVASEYSTSISYEETRAIVGLAVNHGLAEWDNTKFKAKTLERNGGKPLVAPTDASHVTILLSLAEYSRGDFRSKDHERHLRFYAPRQINRFYPGIQEVEGMLALLEKLRGRLRALKEEAP